MTTMTRTATKTAANLRAMIAAARTPLDVQRAKMALTTAATLGALRPADRFALLCEAEAAERGARAARRVAEGRAEPQTVAEVIG